MTESNEQLEEQLRAQVRHVWQNERDLLTINYVRKTAEEKLGLNEGFFQLDSWKARSKSLIKETVEALENEPESPEAPKQLSDTLARPTKRKSPEPSLEPSTKRRKQSASKLAKESKLKDQDSAETEEDEISKLKKTKKTLGHSRAGVAGSKTNPKPRPQKRTRNAGPKKKEQMDSEVESELSDVEDTEDSPLSSPPAKSRTGSASSSGSSDLSSLEDESSKSAKRSKQPKAAPKSKAQPKTAKSKQPVEAVVVGEDLNDEAHQSDSSELSSLIDDPPPSKRGKQKKGSAATAAKPKKVAPAAEDADSAEIKRLQSQLVKCGIRKAWGIELKEHGNDAKAKIRHLRGMLRDAGIDGRFSEQKAREIRERRELMADLEAVKEMNDMWGAATGRPKRGRGQERKPIIDISDLDDDEENDAAGNDKDKVKSGAAEAGVGSGSEDDAGVVTSRARGRSRAMADLAFLGDDDEESD